MRLDAFLASHYSDWSRSQLKQYIANGLVKVNDKIVTKPSFNLDNDDVVEFQKPQKPDFTKDIADFKKYIIFEDANIVVVNKPSGMLAHAKGGITPEFTVGDYLKSVFNKNELAEDPDNNRLGIVHRLDRATSGVMIAAKNLATASMLSRQFAERKSKKTYLAITEHLPRELEAQINLPIGRNISRPATFRVDGKGKSAITNYRVLSEFRDGRALLELKPITGRTHQLRVHLSYIGCPILGDPIYGDGKFGDRLMLHAYQLEISIPSINGTNNQRRIFTAVPPDIFGFNKIEI